MSVISDYLYGLVLGGGLEKLGVYHVKAIEARKTGPVNGEEPGGRKNILFPTVENFFEFHDGYLKQATRIP